MAKTLDQFVKDNTGVGIDTDGAFGFQCMDLMHAYCRDVLGLSDLSILAQPNAKSVWTNFTNVKGHELFEQIPNTPTGVPLKGDIVLYNWGVDGHVDIFIQGDVNSFRSFSQNFPTGSKSAVVNHPNYSGVYGWLRFKGSLSASDALIVCLADRLKFWQERDLLANQLKQANDQISSLKAELKTQTDKANRLEDFRNQIEDLCARFIR